MGTGRAVNQVTDQSTLTHLTQLSMEQLKLETVHFRAMAHGLSSCTCSLRDLELCYISMAGDDDMAAVTLAKALVGNTSVKKLVLYGCQLSDQATTELAKMLRVNSSIGYLDLSENQIGDKGAIELANALLMSSSMNRVKLYENNQIGERGIRPMVDLAEQNLVLEALEVFAFSTCLPEQMEIQRKINAFMDMNNDMGRASQNPGKRPKVWYE
jgi:hypothetical protein